MTHLQRFSLSAFSLLVFTAGLVAQDAPPSSPNQVNGPATKADPSLMDTPLLWVGIVVFGLALLLLFLRKGKTPTGGRKTNVNG